MLFFFLSVYLYFFYFCIYLYMYFLSMYVNPGLDTDTLKINHLLLCRECESINFRFLFVFFLLFNALKIKKRENSAVNINE